MQALLSLFSIFIIRVAMAERCGSGDLTWAWMQNRVQVPARCTELFLISTAIGDAGAAVLAQSLPNAPHLTTLSLYDNGIGELGSRLLAGALPKSRLSALTLWRNKVGNGGARALADALMHASTMLTSLDLHDASIGPQGAAAIAHALAGGSGSMAHDSIAAYMNNTSNSSVYKAAATTKRETKGVLLSTPPPLAWLSLEGNPLGDAGAVELAWALPKSRLTELHLASCGVGDVGAAALAVALLATPAAAAITSATSQLEASTSGLQRYGIDSGGTGSSASASNSRRLSSSSGLAMLFLAQNSISDRGAMALASSLDGSLEDFLTMDANQHHDAPHLLHAMMPTASQLLLPGFLSACTGNADTINGGNGTCTNNGNPYAYSYNTSASNSHRRSGNSHLLALDLSGNDRVSSEALAKVSSLLSRSALAKRRAEVNPRCSAQDLTWWERNEDEGNDVNKTSHTSTADTVDSATTSSDRIQDANSKSSSSEKGYTLRSEVHVPNRCTSLSLLGHPLGDYGVAALSRALIRQTAPSSTSDGSDYLASTGNDENTIPVHDEAFFPLRLTELDLSGVGMGVIGVSALSGALMHTCKDPSGLCHSLKVLFLSSNSIGDEGACALSRALEYSPPSFNGDRSRSGGGGWSMVLEELDLMNAQLGPLAAAALTRALREEATPWEDTTQQPRDSATCSTNVTDLDAASDTSASSTTGASNGDTYCGRIRISTSKYDQWTLRPVPRLQVLHLHGNHLGDDGAEELAKLLMGSAFAHHASPTLRETTATPNAGDAANGALPVAGSETSSVSWTTAAAASLLVGTGPSNLLKLDLGMNGISDRGGIALARALKHNTRLQSLYLDSNGLGPSTGASLVEALKSWGPNTELSALSLAGNPMMNEANGLNRQQHHRSVASSSKEPSSNNSDDSRSSNDSSSSSSSDKDGQEGLPSSFGAAIAELLTPAAMHARQDAQCPALASAHEATRKQLQDALADVAALKRQLFEKDHLLSLLHDDRKLVGWLSTIACAALLLVVSLVVSSIYRAQTSSAAAGLNAHLSPGELESSAELQDKTPLTAAPVAMEDWVETLPGLSSGNSGALSGGGNWSSSSGSGLGSLDLGSNTPIQVPSNLHADSIGKTSKVDDSADSSSSSFDRIPNPIQRPGNTPLSNPSMFEASVKSLESKCSKNNKEHALSDDLKPEDDENEFVARHGFDALLAFDESRANSPESHRTASAATSSSSQPPQRSSATTSADKATKPPIKGATLAPVPVTPPSAVTSPAKKPPVKPTTLLATTASPPSSKAPNSSGAGKRGGKSLHKGQSWEERCSEVDAAAASARSGASAGDSASDGGGWDAPATAVTTPVATTAALAALAAAKAKNEKASTSDTNTGNGRGGGEKGAASGARSRGGNSGRKNRGTAAR